MSSRRYHQKSKNGCAACKRRRVKCDESRPSCRSCTRTGMACVYPMDATIPTPRSDSGSVAGGTPSSPRAKSPGMTHTFDLFDLGLMNHFATVTSVDLFPIETARIAWQTVIPSEAQSHPLLMHGILAVSAAHFACLHPSQASDYRIRALHHHNIALLMYRSALSTMNKGNAHAIFGFSMMLAILAFASPRLTDTTPTMDDVLDKLGLMHGSVIVWKLEAQSILESPMAVLLPTDLTGENAPLSDSITAALADLEEFVQDSVDVSTTQLLRMCLGLAFSAPDELPMAARWVAEVDDDFWRKCKAHDPKALLVLAHYAIVLRHYRQTWWLADWSHILINAIGQALSESDKVFVGWDRKLEFLLHA